VSDHVTFALEGGSEAAPEGNRVHQKSGRLDRLRHSRVLFLSDLLTNLETALLGKRVYGIRRVNVIVG
jgi:hypothetical protein